MSRRMVVNVEQGAANPSVGTLLSLANISLTCENFLGRAGRIRTDDPLTPRYRRSSFAHVTHAVHVSVACAPPGNVHERAHLRQRIGDGARANRLATHGVTSPSTLVTDTRCHAAAWLSTSIGIAENDQVNLGGVRDRATCGRGICRRARRLVQGGARSEGGGG